MQTLLPRLLLLLSCSLLPAVALADEAEETSALATDETDEVETVAVASGAPTSSVGDWYGEAYPEIYRVFDSLTARTVRRGTFNTIINHRSSEGALDAPFDHLLGFDMGGLKVGLGVRYGIMDDWDVAIYRLAPGVNQFAAYEFDTRFRLLKEATHGVDLAVRVGGTWFHAQAANPVGVVWGDNAGGGFGHVVASRLLADRFFLSLGVLGHSHSTTEFADRKAAGEPKYSIAAQGAAEVRLSDAVAWAAEITGTLAGWHDSVPVITTGPRFYTSGHTFAFVVSNGQGSSVDAIVTNTPRYRLKEWVVGFNITRELS
jgi:hypothetical protein